MTGKKQMWQWCSKKARRTIWETIVQIMSPCPCTQARMLEKNPRAIGSSDQVRGVSPPTQHSWDLTLATASSLPPVWGSFCQTGTNPAEHQQEHRGWSLWGGGRAGSDWRRESLGESYQPVPQGRYKAKLFTALCGQQHERQQVEAEKIFKLFYCVHNQAFLGASQDQPG